jgi:hypothetical protein
LTRRMPGTFASPSRRDYDNDRAAAVSNVSRSLEGAPASGVN